MPRNRTLNSLVPRNGAATNLVIYEVDRVCGLIEHHSGSGKTMTVSSPAQGRFGFHWNFARPLRPRRCPSHMYLWVGSAVERHDKLNRGFTPNSKILSNFAGIENDFYEPGYLTNPTSPNLGLRLRVLFPKEFFIWDCNERQRWNFDGAAAELYFCWHFYRKFCFLRISWKIHLCRDSKQLTVQNDTWETFRSCRVKSKNSESNESMKQWKWKSVLGM